MKSWSPPRRRPALRPGLSHAILLLLMESVMSCAAEKTPIYQDHFNLLTVIDEQGQARPVTTPKQWREQRNHISKRYN